jgi:hypothetical protein
MPFVCGSGVSIAGQAAGLVGFDMVESVGLAARLVACLGTLIM